MSLAEGKYEYGNCGRNGKRPIGFYVVWVYPAVGGKGCI